MEVRRRPRCRERATGGGGMTQTWMMCLIGAWLWAAPTCWAAPTECHFNSRGLCEYEGRGYSLGESWMERGCLQCTCLHPYGVGCCETVQQPVDFPAWCRVQIDSVMCRVSLVLTSDPRLPCFQGGGNSIEPGQGETSMS